MQDLMKIIQCRDEITEAEYTISQLIIAEQLAVDEENYEKAQLMLLERAKVIRRKKILIKKLEQI